MKATMRTMALAVVTGCSAAPPASSVAPILYGADDRLEPFELDEPALVVALQAAPAVFRDRNLDVTDPEDIVPLGGVLGDFYDLCPDEPDADGWAASFCSATLIDDDLVVTAGHCVEERTCDELRFVFGWQRDEDVRLPTLTADDVFSCRRIIAGGVASDRDLAIIQLDRPTGREPVTMRMEVPSEGEPLAMVGHPAGLPLQISPVGEVTVFSGPTRYFHTLDSLPGSSGSGVYDVDGRYVGVHYGASDGPVTPDPVAGCNRFTVAADATVRAGSATTVPMILSVLCARRYPSERLCRIAPSCGDGFCTHDETTEACPFDCPTCGDGTCGAAEACPADCPVAPPPSASRCAAAPGRAAAPALAGALLAIAFAARHARRISW